MCRQSKMVLARENSQLDLVPLFVDVHNHCLVVAHHQDVTVLHLLLESDQSPSDRLQLHPIDGK